MAESLSSILSSALQNIGKLVIEEAKFLQGVSEKVSLLRDDLKWIQMFLRHADTKQTARDTIQQWLPEFRAVAYEASDLVEDYALRVSISSNRGFTRALKRTACIAREGYTLHDLGLKIQSLRTRISNLTKNFGRYVNLIARTEEGESSAPSRQQQLRHTYSFVAEEDVVGLRNDVEKLVEHLLKEGESTERKIRVASIVGMGGIGKTTLARKVYHHEKLKQSIKGFAWVCVSQQWQPKDLLQGILLKLTLENREEIMKSKEEQLLRLLREHLGARRCLIVLDDIWSTDAWDYLKDAISVSEHGTKILLTTRKRDVAEHVDPNGCHHELRFLTEDESWELLRKKSLRESSGEGCEDLGKMEELAKKMLNNCRGLPLAVVVLGGILRTKKTLKEWDEVHENIKCYLDKGEKIGKEGEVQKVLAYSYYDLPWQLKPCFLYLGKFGEDSDIGAESLYQMWIGEGMIFENDRKEQETMMDVAERYLKELAIRCTVEIKAYEEGKHAVTELESCRLHDLMRDLCLAKAKEENLYKLVDRSPSRDSSPTTDAQYGLVLRLLPEDISQYNFPPKEQTKHLRSFLCDSLVGKWNYSNSGVRIMSQVKNLKMLRVLTILSFHLASQSCYLKSPLGYVDKLIHLRCLRLRGHRINLPYSLGNLKYLETLDLSGSSHSCRIPNVLWKLERLRYLYLPNHGWGPQCCKLRLSKQLEILESFDNLLCYPEDVCKLSNLRSFKATVYKNFEDLEHIINHISNLDCLRISSLIIRSCNFGKTNSNNSNDSNGSLDVLSRVLFSRNIHELEIRNSLCKKLPDYQSQTVPHPAGLTQLSLSYSGIEEDPMATLEKLPKLRILELGLSSILGQEMSCHSMLFGLGNLMQWKVDEGAMPKLSSLRIMDCPKLEKIPDGLRCLTTLEKVSLVGMPEEFNKRVRKENGQQGEDYDKISHVPSVTIHRLVGGIIRYYEVETVCPINPV
ncbi:putative disease resistance protein At1g50180 [Coffea eugenioides]|uniref:putative disease resistance protein At1g50180 n=1 Tax=Coffea eugenioides TaxID=49369 RepID=UPI000F614DA9|nr:putative disease resistance protein At1g50180 [Coffea eugenioides]